MDHQESCMERIREIMSSTKRTGSFWAEQVIERVKEGKDVTLFAREKALAALDGRKGKG